MFECEPPPQLYTFHRDFGGLINVYIPIFKFMCSLFKRFNYLFSNFASQPNIQFKLKRALLADSVHLSWLFNKCRDNLGERLITASIPVFINAHCNHLNRIRVEEKRNSQDPFDVHQL